MPVGFKNIFSATVSLLVFPELLGKNDSPTSHTSTPNCFETIAEPRRAFPARLKASDAPILPLPDVDVNPALIKIAPEFVGVVPASKACVAPVVSGAVFDKFTLPPTYLAPVKLFVISNVIGVTESTTARDVTPEINMIPVVVIAVTFS